MARIQTLVQLSDELLAEIDCRREREGESRSRSEIIRAAIVAYLADDRDAAVDAVIVDAYTRQPPQADDDLAALGATVMIAAEPWEGPDGI